MERNFRPAAENLYFMGNFSIYFTLVLKTITHPTTEAVIPLWLAREGMAGVKQLLCLPVHPRDKAACLPLGKTRRSEQ